MTLSLGTCSPASDGRQGRGVAAVEFSKLARSIGTEMTL